MKIFKTILISLLVILPSLCFAEIGIGTTGTSGAVISNADANPGFNKANPDRRRVAGSAMILKTDGSISEKSIPSIDEPTVELPSNRIYDGKYDFVQPIVNSK
jgi:hypothetical protein